MNSNHYNAFMSNSNAQAARRVVGKMPRLWWWRMRLATKRRNAAMRQGDPILDWGTAVAVPCEKIRFAAEVAA